MELNTLAVWTISFLFLGTIVLAHSLVVGLLFENNANRERRYENSIILQEFRPFESIFKCDFSTNCVSVCLGVCTVHCAINAAE